MILDILGSPAPIWLQLLYPGVDIMVQNGTRFPPAERYMDNISDPDYVREVNVPGSYARMRGERSAGSHGLGPADL